MILQGKTQLEFFNKQFFSDTPKQLFDLFKCKSKKDEIKALHGVELNPLLLMGFIFKAYTNHSYLFSNYVSEHLPPHAKNAVLPLWALLDEGEIKSFGKTTLSPGQIKASISDRKVIIAKFIDKGDRWMCFFTTHKALKGIENSMGGNQPHFHFTSNLCGKNRIEVLNEFRKKDYNVRSYHIKYHRIKDE